MVYWRGNKASSKSFNYAKQLYMLKTHRKKKNYKTNVDIGPERICLMISLKGAKF